MRAFQGVLDQAWLASALRQSETDVAEDILKHTSLDWSKALREAEQIAGTHLIEVGARSGDLFHVASAVILKAKNLSLLINVRPNWPAAPALR